MRRWAVLVSALVLPFALTFPTTASGILEPAGARRASRAEGPVLPDGFRPAVARDVGRHVYLVRLTEPSLALRLRDRGRIAPSAQRAALEDILAGQASAIGAARALGGEVRFRFGRVVNGFSVVLGAAAAARLADHPDVSLVVPASRVTPALTSSVPFIGAPAVWRDHGARGRGIVVSVIDSGIDYTHANLGGSGKPRDFRRNDPAVIEPGTFPTAKVIGGYDFVGDRGYDPFDDDPTNDRPRPDPDPIDRSDTGSGGHGSHVAGICCGVGVRGTIGKGVAPRARLLSFKVFDEGGVTSDVVIAAIERSIDPDEDGDTGDAADVINMSLGEDFTVSRFDAEAIDAATEVGTIVVAAAGNAGNQPSLSSAYIVGTPGNVPSAIGVASTLDELEAQRLTVDDPAGVELPDDGPIIFQEWSVPFDEDITGEIVDARELDPPADPAGVPQPSDRMLCDAVPPGTPLAGKIALIFKGPFSEGDCFVEDKVINAQSAGAIAVVIWDGFGGLPGPIGTGGNEDQVTIPAVDLSGNDSAALAGVISPDAPSSYNDVAVTVTIGADVSVIPGYEDRMSSFTSEGPTRYTSELKPDVSAPGDAVTSTLVGSGKGALTIGGTSMATPHIAGVVALLRELHPRMSPEGIKALMMNQATPRLRNLDGSRVPATVMGAGRVRADQAAAAVSVVTPGSLSLGLQARADEVVLTRSMRVTNLDAVPHTYRVSGGVRYSDLDPSIVHVRVGPPDGPFRDRMSLTLAAGRSGRVVAEFTFDPSLISPPEQIYGWYYFHPNVDGQVVVRQSGGSGDRLRVPWHVAPLAASDDSIGPGPLDLTTAPGELSLGGSAAAGVSYADLYLLGATDPERNGLEQDILAIGARSFTGALIDGRAEGLPTGTDPLVGLTWQEFLTQADTPAEPVEFLVHAGLHSISDMVETDILIDVGADGVFADPSIGADALLVKLPGYLSAGTVCLFDLPSTFEGCDALYFADYSVYNSTLTGVAADARALGLSDARPVLSYGVVQCSGFFPAIETVVCDAAGAIDPATGTYGPRIDVTDPALAIDPLVCGGFFGGGVCSADDPIQISVGSAAPGDDPGILVAFPNNPPRRQATVVDTRT